MNANLIKTFQILVLALVFLLDTAYCVENEQFNLNDVQMKMYIDGQKVYAINFKALNYFLAEIGLHAANYPPTFKDQKEKDLIKYQLKTLLGMQKKAFTNMKNDLNFLGRYGYSLAMAYNLDMLNSASEVASVFEKALAINQDNPEINYLYGEFLYHAGLPEKSIPHLKKAIDGGIKQAKWCLALIYSSNKATQSMAIELFKEYMQDFPNTQSAKQAKKLVEILKTV
jgi:tetratricopeptide (TPR) repeat protein